MQNINNEMAAMQQQNSPQQAPQGQSPVQGAPAPQGSQLQPQDPTMAGQGQQLLMSNQVIQAMETHMNTLKPVQKAYIAQYLTPELAQIMGMVWGEEAFRFFGQYADQTKILVALPRDEVLKKLRSGGDGSQDELSPIDSQVNSVNSNTQDNTDSVDNVDSEIPEA